MFIDHLRETSVVLGAPISANKGRQYYWKRIRDIIYHNVPCTVFDLAVSISLFIYMAVFSLSLCLFIYLYQASALNTVKSLQEGVRVSSRDMWREEDMQRYDVKRKHGTLGSQ